MISFSARAASLTLYAALIACAPDPVVPADMPAIDAGVAAQVVRQPPVVPAVLPQNVARAKWLEDIPNSHWTGLSPSGRCDAEGTPWIGRSLRPDIRDRPVHCAFDWSGDGAPDGLLLQKTRSDIIALQRDPPAVVAQGELTPKDLEPWRDYRHRLMYERLGKPKIPLPQTGRVRVAVVDTATGVDADVKDDDGHGVAMGLVIRDVACAPPGLTFRDAGAPPATCTQLRMFYYPALARRTEAGRAVLAKDGTGRYGTRSDLAQAIERAVHEWMSAREAELQEGQTKHNEPREQLIINLSVGWSGCWNDANWSPKEDPVYRAILRARCHGAIVVAAAGNIDAVQQPSCPAYGSWRHHDGQLVKRVYPAQFLNEPVTNALDCNILGDAPSVDPNSLTKNLLLGVSAVDEFDEKLSIAAQESSLVSFGHAIPTARSAAAPYSWDDTRSGTSLSAATTSGVVAAVWLSDSKLTAHEVETKILSTAIDLPRASSPSDDPNFLAHWHPDDSRSESVQRISLCAALGDPPDCQRIAFERSRTFIKLGSPPARSQEVPPCDPGSCPASPPEAIDSMEEPWAEVNPAPGPRGCKACYIHRPGSFDIGSGRHCGTCYSSERDLQSFIGHFSDASTALMSFNGELRLGGESYPLWSSPPRIFVTAEFPLGAVTAAGASIHYRVLEDAGVVEYDEAVVVESPYPTKAAITPARPPR